MEGRDRPIKLRHRHRYVGRAVALREGPRDRLLLVYFRHQFVAQIDLGADEG